MASLDTPITWIPFMNNKNCSKSNCSIYFPQLGYTIYPPSPPLEFPPDHDDNSSNPSFSPLIIAIIGIFASVFLLVSYYTIISTCSWSKNNGAISSTRDEDRNRDDDNDEDDDQMLEENQNPFLHEPWQAVATTTTTGLDEAFINSITVYRYRKGDGLVCVTDCSVCLSEFEEDEFVKLLPKCSHGFHVSCIDTWLKSHSNCPLCRANVVCVGGASTLPPETTTPVLAGSHEEDGQVSSAENGVVAAERDDDAEEETVVLADDDHRKNPLRVYSHDDAGNMELRSIIIDIRD